MDINFTAPVWIPVDLSNGTGTKSRSENQRAKFACESVINQISKKNLENVSIFLIIFEEKIVNQIRNQVKFHCDTVLGKPSQFFKKLNKADNLSIMKNVTL